MSSIPEGQDLQAAMHGLHEQARTKGSRTVDIATTSGYVRASVYKFLSLKTPPPWKFLWSLFLLASRLPGEEDPNEEEKSAAPRHTLPDLLILLTRWQDAQNRTQLADKVRRTAKELAEKGASEAGQAVSAEFAALEDAATALEQLPYGENAGFAAVRPDQDAAVSTAPDPVVAPVPFEQGDRRNDPSAAPPLPPTQHAAIAAAREHWNAGRLPDALHVLQAIAADHPAESLLFATQACKTDGADSALETLLSSAAERAAEDPYRIVRTTRLLLEAGYHQEALLLEAAVEGSSRFPAGQ